MLRSREETPEAEGARSAGDGKLAWGGGTPWAATAAAAAARLRPWCRNCSLTS